MGAVLVRRAQPADLDRLAAMCHELSPETSKEEHSRELAPILQGRPPGTLPPVIFVAGTDVEGLAGFIEVGLCSHADGCDPATRVGYVEGWYVDARHRGHRIGAPLLAAAQDWTRGHGCVEWLRTPGSTTSCRSRFTKLSGSRWWTAVSITGRGFENRAAVYFTGAMRMGRFLEHVVGTVQAA